MRPARRATAAVMLLLLLQAWGLGSGVSHVGSALADCGMTTAHASSDMEGMGERPMSHAPTPSSERGSKLPCGLPWAMGCVSMSACLSVLAPVTAVSAPNAADLYARIPAANASVPESLVRTPDVPPPRG